MNRRRFLKYSTACSVLFSSLARGMLQVQENKLNVVILLTDDQGVQLECMGTKGIKTPHTSRIAREGVLFENAFSTCASCSPARSGILTGMYPHSNGHWRNTHGPSVTASDKEYSRDTKFKAIEKVGVHEDIPTIVEILNSQGYITGITQKFHLSPVWKYPFGKRIGVDTRPSSHYLKAKEFFDGCGDRPFFLLANIGNTHRPFNKHIPEIGVPRVNPNDIDLPENLADTEMMRKDFAEYLDTVQCADACVGGVLNALAESGKYENTLLIFTSDQGYCYHRAKATAYDAGIRVPMIIAGPGIRRNASTSKLVSHVDIFPTIIDYIKKPIPGSVQGRSLKPILEGRSVLWRPVVFAEHNSHGPNPLEYYPTRSAFDGRFHYIRNLMYERKWTGDPDSLVKGKIPPEIFFAGPADAFPVKGWGNKSYAATVLAREKFPRQYELLKKTFNRPPEELYDFKKDPYEMEDLSMNPEYKVHLERLRKLTYDWMEETSDPGIDLQNTPRRENV